MPETPLATKAVILSDLWMNYRDDEEFNDFIEYNDLGLPLSYMLTAGIVKGNNVTNDLINETFNLLLAALETEDQGFADLDDLLGYDI